MSGVKPTCYPSSLALKSRVMHTCPRCKKEFQPEKPAFEVKKPQAVQGFVLLDTEPESVQKLLASKLFNPCCSKRQIIGMTKTVSSDSLKRCNTQNGCKGC